MMRIRESIPDRRREPEAFAKWVAGRLAGPEEGFELYWHAWAELLANEPNKNAMIADIAEIVSDTNGIPEPTDE